MFCVYICRQMHNKAVNLMELLNLSVSAVLFALLNDFYSGYCMCHLCIYILPKCACGKNVLVKTIKYLRLYSLSIYWEMCLSL